jgi:tetratricopeptide (TPR) repeat protein
MGNTPGAITAFQLATRFNPALIASWTKLSECLAASGNQADAHQSGVQASRLQALPRELLAVINHIHENRVLRAEEICRAFLKKHPRNVEGMRLLAEIGSRLSVLTDADFLLETAIELEPENLQLRIDHIQVLRKRQKYEAAHKQAQFLYDKAPDNPLFQSLLAIESMHAGDIDRALDLFDSVLTQMPDDLAALTSRGHALKTFGRSEDAIASYRRSVEVSPHHGDGWYALANLKTFRFTSDDIATMQTAEQYTDLPLMAHIHIAFALGKALEDAGRYDEAFAAYERGNTLKRHQTRYTSEQMDAEFAGQKTQCTRALFEERKATGCTAPDPIFIVGLPRAGSTLLEQILASHSQVDGTLELPNILALSHRLRGRNHITDRERYPRILHELDDAELEKLGQDYINNTRVHRQGAPFFTDKMPNNFRHIGLIHLILPNAKIIDARRAPLDCCWSGYKQLFAEGQEFTYGLAEIGHYYAGYVDLMDHWNSVLPEGRILRVQHEDVLEDLEFQVRRILDYCDLPFEQACVDFHKTDRAVRTASSEQVRQPINSGGVEQWRPFEHHLAPLKAALGSSAPQAEENQS